MNEEKKQETQIINDATIYLTFDDGPGPYTETLLNTLEEYNVKAVNYFYGIGGRDYTVESATSVFEDLMKIADGSMEPENFKYVGLRK